MKTNEIILWLVLFIVLATPLIFWVRGIVRGSKTDLVAAVSILVVISFGLVVTANNPQVFSLIGVLLFIFGVATLIAGYFAKPDCLISRTARIIIAVVLFLVLFLFFCPVL